MRRDRLDGTLVLPPGATITKFHGAGIDQASIPGIVIDDDVAELKGSWSNTGSLTGFVGESYRYSGDPNATARFPFTIGKAGRYEVRVAWLPHANRARSASVTVQCAAGEKAFLLNQTLPAQGWSGFQSLGTFKFAEGEKAEVRYRVRDAKGLVHIDAVQVVPVD